MFKAIPETDMVFCEGTKIFLADWVVYRKGCGMVPGWTVFTCSMKGLVAAAYCCGVIGPACPIEFICCAGLLTEAEAEKFDTERFELLEGETGGSYRI